MESHSATGLMKAHWNGQDFAQMKSKFFTFTPDAMEMIQANLAKRQSGATLVSRAF